MILPATSHQFSNDDLLRLYVDVSGYVESADYTDGYFFTTHRARYVHLLNRMQALAPAQQFPRVLELGSYHLHLSMLLTRIGYQVNGVDLPVFSRKPAVVRRAAEFGIANNSHVLDVLGKPVGIPYDCDAADVVVCTEMLEHITFNPVRFWSEVYRIIRPEGLIILTTPNSLSLMNTLAQLKRLLLRRSVGIMLDRFSLFGHQRASLEGILAGRDSRLLWQNQPRLPACHRRILRI